MQLLFYKDSFGPFEWAIRLFTWSKYNHVELAIDHGPGWAVVWSSSERDGGVRLKRIEVRPEAWDAVDIPDTPEAIEWFKKHQWQGYDWWGVARFVLPFIPQKKDKWFCSEAVAASLGLNKPHRWTPGGLYRWAIRQQAQMQTKTV